VPSLERIYTNNSLNQSKRAGEEKLIPKKKLKQLWGRQEN